MTDTIQRMRIEPELILTNLVVKDRWEAIDRLSELMLKKGYVTEAFPAKTKEREEGFPTALPTKPYPVAIPHTWAEFCIEPALALGILAEPIPWIEMGTKDRWQEVRIVLLLSITQPEAQVQFLQKVIDFFIKEENQEKLIANQGVESIRLALHEGLNLEQA